MATPVEMKQGKKDKDMRSQPGRERTIDPSVVSAEAPVPDIVGRLLKAKPDEHCNDSLCAEAADEITRLTAENERLRAALEQASDALFDAGQLDAWADTRIALNKEPRT